MGLSARARDALLALALAMLASLYTAGGADTHAKQAAELPLATHTHVVPRATPARLAALSKGAAHAFPANISGSYVGSWSLEPPRAPLELRLGGADDESKSGGGAKGRKGQRAVEQPRITPFPRGTSGAVLLQLRAAAARGGVRGVDDVLGEMVVRDGEYLSDRDVHLALAGAYVPALGQLRAVVAQSQSHLISRTSNLTHAFPPFRAPLTCARPQGAAQADEMRPSAAAEMIQRKIRVRVRACCAHRGLRRAPTALLLSQVQPTTACRRQSHVLTLPA